MSTARWAVLISGRSNIPQSADSLKPRVRFEVDIVDHPREPFAIILTSSDLHLKPPTAIVVSVHLIIFTYLTALPGSCWIHLLPAGLSQMKAISYPSTSASCQRLGKRNLNEASGTVNVTGARVDSADKTP